MKSLSELAIEIGKLSAAWEPVPESMMQEYRGQIVRICTHFRDGHRAAYGDRYTREVDNRIGLVRQVMRDGRMPALSAAFKIMNRNDENRRNPLFICAAVEIIEQETAPVSLN